MTLTELREKICKFIPRRSVFLNNENKIDPSKEDFTIIKNIEMNKSIYIEVPVEDTNDTMEIEIYLNGKIYIKKYFYIIIKLKALRNNLKFDHSYKIVFKNKTLTIEEENNMTLDLCSRNCFTELHIQLYSISAGL